MENLDIRVRRGEGNVTANPLADGV